MSDETQTVEQTGLSWKLIIGIILMPYIFAWFTLRDGVSKGVKIISFIWMIGVIGSITTQQDKYSFEKAIKSGDIEVVMMMLDESKNQKTKDHLNALQAATKFGQVELVKALFKQGYSPLDTSLTDNDNSIYIAIENNQTEVLSFFAKQGYDVDKWVELYTKLNSSNQVNVKVVEQVKVPSTQDKAEVFNDNLIGFWSCERVDNGYKSTERFDDDARMFWASYPNNQKQAELLGSWNVFSNQGKVYLELNLRQNKSYEAIRMGVSQTQATFNLEVVKMSNDYFETKRLIPNSGGQIANRVCQKI